MGYRLPRFLLSSESSTRTLSHAELINLLGSLSLLSSFSLSLAVARAYGFQVEGQPSVLILLVSLNALVFVVLSILYLIAAKLFNDASYAATGFAWLLAAVAYIFEAITRPVTNIFFYEVGASALSLLPIVLFYVGSLIPDSASSKLPRVGLKVCAWLMLTIILSAGGSLLSRSIDLHVTDRIIFYGAQVPFTVWALIKVGRRIDLRITMPRRSFAASHLASTFYFYGIIQLLYLPAFVQPTIFLLVFSLSLGIKAVNALFLMNIMQSEFERIQDQLIQRSVLEDIGVLTASIEHDIRNPLGVIDAEIHLIRSRLQDQPKLTGALNKIAKQVERIYWSTQIVSLLRGSADYYQRTMERVSATEIIRRAIRQVRELMDTSDIAFKLDLRRDLYVKANGPMFEQVLVNILKNAVEAIREATPATGTVDINVSLDLPGHVLKIDVSDNGCGVAEEDIPKLTTLFTTKADRGPSRGIGLFISQRIVKLHGGSLSIVNNAGEGTTVSISLPQAGIE